MSSNATITGRLDVDSTMNQLHISTGAAVIDGGLGIGKNINVGGDGVNGKTRC